MRQVQWGRGLWKYPTGDKGVLVYESKCGRYNIYKVRWEVDLILRTTYKLIVMATGESKEYNTLNEAKYGAEVENDPAYEE